MSYICLMANRAGAVIAGDSRETFPAKVHLDWRLKVFALPERQMVWGVCGPTLRLGTDLIRWTKHILQAPGETEEKLEKVGQMVSTLTRLSSFAGKAGPFHLLIAQVCSGQLHIWDAVVYQGQLKSRHLRPAIGQPVFLHAGAWCSAMPEFDPEELRELDYDALREAARTRAALAIERDEARRAANPRHNQTIGGQIHLASLRCLPT